MDGVSDIIPDEALASASPASSGVDDLIPRGALASPKALAGVGADDDYWVRQASDEADAESRGARASGGTILHGLSGLGSSIIGGWRGLSELVQGHGVDAAADAVREEQQNRTFQGEEGGAAAAGAKALDSGYNPLNWPGIAIHKAGEKSADWGAPPWLSTGIETAGNAGLLLAGGEGAASRFGGASRAAGGAEDAAAVARAADSALPKAPVIELSASGEPRAVPAQAPAAPAPKVSASGTPRAAYFEPTDSANAPRFAEDTPAAPPGKTLSPEEQAQRKAILQRVGVQETRQSAIEGDAPTASNEYQESKLTSANGRRMKDVIDGERRALSDHADSLIEGTGGTPGSALDESVRTERGNAILAPLDALKDHFDTATRALYKEADARAGGNPAPLSGFADVLKDDSNLTNSDRVQLKTALGSYLKKIGMTGDDGSIAGTPAQAETVRKYLNENWSPQNSKLVGTMKDALDDDVTKNAGEDIYSQARQMRALRARTLDDPDGISKIMDASGPQGINRAVPVEKIADAVTSLPVKQLDHIVGTLKNLPDDLQPLGDQALNEIKAHMASKIADKGQSTQTLWNAKGVTQSLAQNSQRMKLLFGPEELQKFGDLNDAGNILKKDQSYPGAAVQANNLVRKGAMGAIQMGTTGAGHLLTGLTGIPGGEIVGAVAGEKLAGKWSEAQALKNVEKRIVKLNPSN